MKGINIFIIFWVLTALLLLIISMHYKRQSDAIVAQVEPEKIAISFQKPVKIKSIYVIPGQEVEEGELLMELERPDLLYDIDILTNQMDALLQERMLFLDNIDAQIELANLERLSEMNEIEEEINLLAARQNQTREIISSFETLDSESKEKIQEQKNMTSLRIQMLEEHKNQISSIYEQKVKQLENRKGNELEIFDLQLKRLRQEENLLSQEKTYLKNYAPINGTVGDVYAQAGELISPYETIITLYEKHPKIIKAYMNEKNRYQLNVGGYPGPDLCHCSCNVVISVTRFNPYFISYI
jgi:HlyD family secretion protein